MFNIFSVFICAIVLSTTTDVVQGRFKYVPEAQRWMAQTKLVASWQEAKEQCETEGSTLASPINTQLLKYMQSYIDVNNHSTAYFIGIKARYNPRPQFVSVEGFLLEDMAEAAIDMIEQLDPRDGDCLSMDRESIRVVPCWWRLPYICYTNVNTGSAQLSTEPVTTDAKISKAETANIIAENTTPAVGTCVGAGYELSPATGSCYKLHQNALSWAEANETCNREEGYVVILNDEKEALTINEMFISAKSWGWVGLRVDTEFKQWRSVKGNTLDQIYNVWYAGYEYENPNKDVCAALIRNFLFDEDCDKTFVFICEKNM